MLSFTWLFSMGWCGLLFAKNLEPCFSCDIKVRSLRAPLDLSGNWLFTRDDLPRNKDPETKTSSWVTVATPGSWNGAYPDGARFDVGWYRANFWFSPRLVGKKVVFYLDAGMNQLEIFLDGVPLMAREGQTSHEQYFGLQPIPIVFSVSKSVHVLTMRIISPAMQGVMEGPLQLRPYQAFDATVTYGQLFASETRIIAAYLLLLCGILFIVLHGQTAYALYLAAGLSGFAIFPYLAFPHDSMIKFFPPQKLWVLHYAGFLAWNLAVTSYSQSFFQITPGINRLNKLIVGLLAALFLVLSLQFHPQLFRAVRIAASAYGLWMTLHMVSNLYHAWQRKRRVALLLSAAVFFLICSLQNFFGELGWLEASSWRYPGVLVLAATVSYQTMRLLVGSLARSEQPMPQGERLRPKVDSAADARHRELFAKKQNLSLALESLPEGMLILDANLRVQPEYSLALERTLETAHIEGRDVFQLLFAHSSVGLDEQTRMRSILQQSFAEGEASFAAQKEQLITEFEAAVRGEVKVLALLWTAIANPEGQLTGVLLKVTDISHSKQTERDAKLIRLRARIAESVFDGSGARIHDFVERAVSTLQTYGDALLDGEVEAGKIELLQKDVQWMDRQARTFELYDLLNEVEIVGATLRDLEQQGGLIEAEALRMMLQSLLGSLQQVLLMQSEVLGKMDPSSIMGVQEVHPKLWKRFKTRWQHFDPSTSHQELADLQRDIHILSFKEARTSLTGLTEALHDLVRTLNASTPLLNLDVEADLFLDPKLAESLFAMLLVLLRNSLIHGLESRDERQLLNKPERGQISVTIRVEGSGFVLLYSDDGRGLDLEQIRRRIQTVDPNKAENSEREALLGFLLGPGLHTSAYESGLAMVGKMLQSWNASWQWPAPASAAEQLLPFNVSIQFPVGSFLAREYAAVISLAL